MTPKEIGKAAQAKIKGRPDLEAGLREAWAPVEEMVDALASTYIHRNYAFQRMHRIGRLEMLTQFVGGSDPADCASAAVDAIATDYNHHYLNGGYL